MAKVLGIGGVFFRARDPGALAGWYAQHLGLAVALEGGGGMAVLPADGGVTVWAPFPADTDYFGPGGQSLMVNYRVDDLDAILARLREAGAAVESDVQTSEQGRFGWATDPEGNRFELWEPAPDPAPQP